ncbi:MAG: geranylgeranyl reductase family protein [Candidatus Riflebacteria bacterium]|nr:geranylgeranyl reductase family protein [Candidatus Riflebacteria bacterium]
MSQIVDILIVGAGPAGTTLARSLALKGLHPLLIERAILPRHKPCGGGIPARTEALLGFSIEPVGGCRVTSIALDGAWTGRRIYGLDPSHGLTVVDRARFDEFLARKAVEAGAELRENCGARRVTRLANGFFSVETTRGDTIEARRIAVCDGVFSPTGKALGFPPNVTGFCLEGVMPMPGNISSEARSRAIFNLAMARGGYAWSFPRNDGFAIGIGGPCSNGRFLKKRLRYFLARTPELRGHRLNKLFGGMIPDFAAPRKVYVDRGAWLVGDAAGLVDPLSGEGIYYAITSAIHATESILSNDEQLYGRRLAENLLPELALAARVAARFRSKIPLLIGLALSWPSFGDRAKRFVDLLTGQTSYRDLYAELRPQINKGGQ